MRLKNERRFKKMKSKKGANIIGIVLILLLVAILAVIVLFLTGVIPSPITQQVTPPAQVEQISQATKTGDIAQIKAYVYDVSQNNVNTKTAVPIYCQDDMGKMIVDGTTSSTSAETTITTSIGRTVTCWAFNATMQMKQPVTMPITIEKDSIRLDTFRVPINAQIAFYNDQLATGTAGKINVTSVGADTTGTLQKMRIKNNNTDTILPLGGVYFNTISNSNVSDIDVSGSAILYGSDHSSTSILNSNLATSVSSRKDNWDFVFELDDSAQAGNQVLYLEENDYLESGVVSVKGDGDGCATSTISGELISSYGFTKGYFRQTKGTGVGYSYETDASSASVISTDLVGDEFYCVSD